MLGDFMGSVMSTRGKTPRVYSFPWPQSPTVKQIDAVAAAAVTAPGIPPAYPDPARLITDDCIRP